jgi:ABC-type sugar transport system ATPase subunit
VGGSHPEADVAVALLELAGISKHFGGVRALINAHVSVDRGEVRGLVGENGSGKTTLLRILAGALAPHAGTVHVDGHELPVLDTTARLEAGVGAVFQDAQICPDLTVGENLLLGHLPSSGGRISWKEIHRVGQKVIDDAGLPLNSRSVVRRIPQDAQHLTEVARIESLRCRVIAFDETTASLTSNHVALLFELIKRRRDDGAAVLFISHRLHEVFEICDSITVLRDGEVRGTVRTESTTEDEVIRLMVGRDLEAQHVSEPRVSADIRLKVKDLVAGRISMPVSLQVHAGEVVGVGGLVGSGRSTLLTAIHGLTARKGEVRVGDIVVPPHDPRAAIRAGIGLVPEDRRKQGLAMEKSVRANATMILTGNRRLLSRSSRTEEDAVLEVLYDKLALKAPSSRAPARTLSGGNQQKLVLGRWLAHRPGVLLLDEPTRGIDVVTKREIYELIDALAAEGTAILLVSSELPELLGLCDRILVFREGRLAGEFRRGVSEEELVTAMAGSATHLAS